MILRHHNNHLRQSIFTMIISDSVMDAIQTASTSMDSKINVSIFFWIIIDLSNKYDIEWCPVLQIIQMKDTHAVVHDTLNYQHITY